MHQGPQESWGTQFHRKVRVTFGFGERDLREAARTGNVQEIQRLVNLGVDIRKARGIKAAVKGNQPQILQVLLRNENLGEEVYRGWKSDPYEQKMPRICDLFIRACKLPSSQCGNILLTEMAHVEVTAAIYRICLLEAIENHKHDLARNLLQQMKDNRKYTLSIETMMDANKLNALNILLEYPDLLEPYPHLITLIASTYQYYIDYGHLISHILAKIDKNICSEYLFKLTIDQTTYGYIKFSAERKAEIIMIALNQGVAFRLIRTYEWALRNGQQEIVHRLLANFPGEIGQYHYLHKIQSDPLVQLRDIGQGQPLLFNQPYPQNQDYIPKAQVAQQEKQVSYLVPRVGSSSKV